MIFLTTFALVFLWNLVPLFTPPTWMVLSFVSFKYHPQPLFTLALVGAVAATAGRAILAKCSYLLIRQKILSEKTKRNIDEIKTHLQDRRNLTFGIFLFYAFSPLPSNQLFIAYGLTDLPLKLVVVPFFIGRLISYGFWIFTASEISKRLAVEQLQSRSYMSGYFIISQLFTIFIVWLFTKLDWKVLFRERKIKLVK